METSSHTVLSHRMVCSLTSYIYVNLYIDGLHILLGRHILLNLLLIHPIEYIMQCDRHAQNMLIDERGQLKLIDNDAAFQLSYMRMLCAVDSLLIPTTQKHVTARLSNKVREHVSNTRHR